MSRAAVDELRQHYDSGRLTPAGGGNADV